MTTETVMQPDQDQYYALIDELLRCPSGSEPEILDNHPELLNAQLVQTLVQVGTAFAHQNQQDASHFLFFLARNLAKGLGLQETSDE